MISIQHFPINPECRYEITDPEDCSQRLWLLAACLTTNVVQVYEGVIVPVLWSRQNEEPIVSTEILTRSVGSEPFDFGNTYELWREDAQENGKDIGMILASRLNEKHLEQLKQYITDHLYEVYEQLLFQPWIKKSVEQIRKNITDAESGVIATMHVPGFGPISGVSQKTETNSSGVLIYTTPEE